MSNDENPNDRLARSEGFRDSAHRTRVINGEPYYASGCLVVLVAVLVMWLVNERSRDDR